MANQRNQYVFLEKSDVLHGNPLKLLAVFEKFRSFQRIQRENNLKSRKKVKFQCKIFRRKWKRKKSTLIKKDKRKSLHTFPHSKRKKKVNWKVHMFSSYKTTSNGGEVKEVETKVYFLPFVELIWRKKIVIIAIFVFQFSLLPRRFSCLNLNYFMDFFREGRPKRRQKTCLLCVLILIKNA